MTLIKVMARCCTQTRSLPLGKASSYGSNRKATLLTPDFGWGPKWDQNNTVNQCHVCKATFLNRGASAAITPSFSSLLLASSGRPQQLKTSPFLSTNLSKLPKTLTASCAKPWKTSFQGKKQPGHRGGSIKSWAVFSTNTQTQRNHRYKGFGGISGTSWDNLAFFLGIAKGHVPLLRPRSRPEFMCYTRANSRGADIAALGWTLTTRAGEP